jgi:hypothetical protein
MIIFHNIIAFLRRKCKTFPHKKPLFDRAFVIGEDAASFPLVLPYMGIKKGSCRKKENTLLIYHVYVNFTR